MSEHQEPELPFWLLVVMLLISVSITGWALSCVGEKQAACEEQGKVLVRTTFGHTCVSK